MRAIGLALITAGLLISTSDLQAGAIRKACQKSDRPSASASLCSCIQSVANQNLSYRERKRVARWFVDPQQAQVTRMSDRFADEQLWARYKRFGQEAHKICG